MLSDGSDLTRVGNAFQALAAATGKARSSECGTSHWRYQKRDGAIRPRVSSNVRRTHSAKYAGSPSCRQWCISTQQLENGGGSQGKTGNFPKGTKQEGLGMEVPSGIQGQRPSRASGDKISQN